MRVRVNPEKCQGHQRCFALAPDLFEVDDLGTSTAIGGGVVPPHQQDLARRVAANCPEYAIEIIEI